MFTRKRIIIGIITLLLAGLGWFGFKFLYNLHQVFGNGVFSVLTTGKLDGEDQGRVNILLAGNSADDVGHDGATLTDSIMILSIDTKNNTGYMMSIPRDLYVDLGDSYAKINSAYPVGEADEFSQAGYFDGGMGLLQKVIEENFGIKANYYALVNYNALRDAVNSVGGIDITIDSSDSRGLYDPSRDYSAPGAILVDLANGKHTLNGQQALNLARARGDAYGSYGFSGSDFTRTENQRKIILALRNKATSAGVLTNPVKLSNLFDAVGSNVETNLTLANVKRLYYLTKDLKGSGIQSVGLNDADGVNLLANYTTPGGSSALVPAAGVDDFSDIQAYIQRLESPDLMVRENAEVVVLNGTATYGLASKTADILAEKNFRVDTVGDSGTEDQVVTKVINISGDAMPNTLKALKNTFKKATFTKQNDYAEQYPDADFIVIIGSNWADGVAASSTD